jgi:spermidine/putrescine transport system ATP-binding protein
MVRPERMWVERELTDPDRWQVEATVTEMVFQGPVVRYELALPGDVSAVAHVPAGRDELPRPGDTVHASWEDGAGILLPGSPELAPVPDLDADD